MIENDHPKVKPIKMLQIDNTQEFPALSSGSKISTQKPATAPSWGSLFASQAPKPPHRIHHPPPSPLAITPTMEMSSPSALSIEGKEKTIPSPTAVECMSVLSNETGETGETAVEEEETTTPWDSPTAKKEGEISQENFGDLDSDATIVFPDVIEMDNQSPPQKELLPPFKFPGTKTEPEVDLNNDQSELAKGKKMEFEELSEAERHDTPSYISGGLPLRQVVETDPHRVVHAIKNMMHGIVTMKKQLGAPPDDLEYTMRWNQRTLQEIDILTEHERRARLAVETKEAAIKEARLAMEKERASAAKEMDCSKSATKFNPGAKPFSPSNFMSSESMGPAPPVAMAPALRNSSPLKFSAFHEPGFMVEQSRNPPAPFKFHPLLNRSRTLPAPLPPTGPYAHFNTYHQRQMSPIFMGQLPLPSPMVAPQLSPYFQPNVGIDPEEEEEEAIVRSPPQSPSPIQSQLDLSLADRTLLRTPVAGKTDHKSTPTSPTKQLSADDSMNSLKATSTNTSPRRRDPNLQPIYPPHLYQTKPSYFKLLIPPTNTADDIQKAVFILPKTHRHICPSSLTSPDYKCPVPNCLLQQICPYFTGENGCSFRPPPLNGWPWNPSDPLSNQAQQCPFVHIPGSCLHSISYFRDPSTPPSESTPREQQHHCPIPFCATTRMHSWGCAKDWQTGFAINGLTPIAPPYRNPDHQLQCDLSNEWRWRLAMEGLRVVHEKGQYGCRGGSMPPNASFPPGHPGANVKNWGPSVFTGKGKQNHEKTYASDKERGRLRGAWGAGGRGLGKGGSTHSRSKVTRENSHDGSGFDEVGLRG